MGLQAENEMVVFRIGARFNGADADQLRHALESLAPFSHLVLDFTGVREFHDSASFSLANALRAFGNVQVTLRGLTHHQFRLMRYLDVP